jgi:two-component system chemotaxis response regulator CheB
LIVQHLPENFTTFLAKRLDTVAALAVREAAHRTLVQPGFVWIAPGNLHLETRSTSRGVELATTDGALVNSCRPAADVLFRSAAKCYGPSVLAVVLTGMGQDGLDGCREISAAGGQVIVQDRATSVVWGMPGQVAEAGLAESVLPVSEIGAEIVRRVKASAR